MNYFYKGKRILPGAPVSFSAEAATLASGERLVCVEEMDNKKNAVLTSTAFFESFDSLTLAHGYQQNYGNHVVVDGTHVRVYYGSASALVREAAHGLTVSEFLTVSVRQGKTNAATVTITTAGGSFSLGANWYGSRGSAVLFGTQAMTDAKLTYGLDDAAKDVYVFTDSYGSISDTGRWPHYFADAGYDGFLLCGHGGANSAQIYPQFETLIGLAQPKLAVWMLGMNDADTASAVNASWKTHAERFVAACEAKGVVPVLTTIPNVPNYRHTFKNDWIKASGCRYVDWAKAVGAETAGASWYEGMLSADNVHPTALGAKTLAARLLLDVPEMA